MPDDDGRIRVLLLLTSLHGGGAEKVAVHLLNRLDPQRFDVRMGLLRAAGPWLDHIDPDKRDRVIVARNGDKHFVFEGTNASFYRPDKLMSAAARAPLAFRRMVRDFRPHVAMSFLKGTHVIAWAALAGIKNRPRWIAREGNNTLAVIREETSNAVIRSIVTRLTSRAYARADAVLVNASDMADGVAADFGLDRKRMRVINNPIDIAEIERLADAPLPEAPTRPFIVTVGRLEYQKAHDVLIRAFAASSVRATHDLVIVGRGALKDDLLRLADDLGIRDSVAFEGFCDNPYAWVARAALFVLPSRWEGFPTAAAEALACGVPVLLSDCEFGPRDVLEHGKSGWIVPVDNEPALRDAIEHLIADPALCSLLVEGGRARVERFGLDAMLARYDVLLAE